MKIFFDTEFTGLHKDTTLISIGLVSETGETFYAELTDYDHNQVDPWIRDHVIANLKYPDGECYGANCDGHGNLEVFGDKKLVRDQLCHWLNVFDSPQLISDVSHYDMVLLIDLFGDAFKFTRYTGACAACHDINQDIAKYYDVDEFQAFDKSREEILTENAVSVTGEKHNSLYDAQVIKAIYEIVCER